MLLSVITAPIVLAHLSDFLNRRCHVNPNVWIFILQIWHTSPIQDINKSAPTLLPLWWSPPIGQNSQRFAYSSRQCLFIKLWQPETEKMQGCGSTFISSGSGSRSSPSIFDWIPIRIQGFNDQKLNKNYSWKKTLIFWGSKTTIYLSLGLHKERPSYRRNMNFKKKFLLLCVIFALLDPDPDTDPDPQPWNNEIDRETTHSNLK